MSRPAVVFDGVWKKFRRGERHDSLRDLVPNAVRNLLGRKARTELSDQEFWALNDVSFEVKSGEALGIIGTNGAGKSTVLKTLTRLLKPTRGTSLVVGRVGALIEVAAGFHPDLTGRENVFLQAAIMGMTSREAAERFDSIVAFSGVEEFIDTQLKRYSSGMNARLGFAIAAHFSPDVLIIDEVLSVGDSFFQAKCAARIEELKSDGTTIVFVSHNLPAVESLCDDVLLLERGRVTMKGRPRETIARYLATAGPASKPDATGRPVLARTSGQDVWFTAATLYQDGQPADSVLSGSKAVLRLTLCCAEGSHQAIVGFAIRRLDGHVVFGENTSVALAPIAIRAGEAMTVEAHIQSLALPEGAYTLDVGAECSLSGKRFDAVVRAVEFRVLVRTEFNRIGSITLPSTWCIAEPQPDVQVDAVGS